MADREDVSGQGAESGADDDRSWMDRCADEEVAGRGPHRGRGPQSWAPDDRRIYEAVCERLLHDRLIDARGMEVEVDGGVVTLRGTAAHASDPALARLLVRETPGVKDVVTELSVLPHATEPAHPAEEDPHARSDRSPLGYPILPT